MNEFETLLNEKPLEVAVHEYVDSVAFSVKDHLYSKWQEIANDIAEYVRQFALADHKSATQYPLLALPYLDELLRDKTPLDEVQVGRLLGMLYTLLEQAHATMAHHDNLVMREHARKLLATYSGYGRRWEAMARCTVPLDKPFTIRVEDKRDLHFEVPTKDDPRYATADARFPRLRKWFFTDVWHLVAFADAASNHVDVRVQDSVVRLVPRSCCAKSEIYESLPNPDDEQRTYELYSRYDSDTQRSDRIYVKSRLRLATPRWWLLFGMIAVTLSAVYLMVRFGFIDYSHTHLLNPADAVAILIPVTFAASLLLVRESSTLGMRVKKRRQLLLMFLLVALWGITFALYVIHRISVDGVAVK